MIPRTLDRYIAGRYLAIYLACLASFIVLYVSIDSVSQYTALAEKSRGFLGFLTLWTQYYVAQVPLIFCRFFGPVTAAAAAGFTATLFLRANEFTPLLAAGISLQRILVPVVAMTVATCALWASVQELWIPGNRDAIQKARALGRGSGTATHVKFFDRRRRVLVSFLQYNFHTLEAQGVLVYAPPGAPGGQVIIEARRASWQRKRWTLEDVTVQRYDERDLIVPPKPPAPETGSAAPSGPATSAAQPDAGGPPPAAGPALTSPGPPPLAASRDPAVGRLLEAFDRKALNELVEVDMIPQDLEERESQEPYLRLSEIIAKVRRSPESTRWRVRLFSRFADPLHSLVLVLLGIPTILQRGTRNVFLSAIATMVISGLYFVVFVVSINLGNRGFVSPGLATGLAPVLFGSLGVTLYVRMRS